MTIPSAALLSLGTGVKTCKYLWGYDFGYPWQAIWAAPPEVVQPTRRRLTVHDAARRVPQDIKGDIMKMLRDLLGCARSRDSCNMLLLTGYLLDLTDL